MMLASPQSGLLTLNGTFFAEVAAFILMILILGRYAYPRIIKAATAREEKIEAGLRAAAEAEQRLSAVQAQVEKLLEEARTQAREIINRSHGEASAEASEVIAKSRSDAEGLIERARTEIQGERDRAIQDLRAEVASLVVAATEQLLGEAIDAKAHQRLIEASLNKVGDGAASKAQQN
jgi:F-type H+-transporting ATPase subunit b